MKKVMLVAIIGAFAVSVNAGDWGGKEVVVEPKVPIGCPDTDGYVTVGYETDYIYKGYRFGTDTVVAGAGYTFDSIVPVTLSATHYNIAGSRNTILPAGFAPGALGGGLLLGLEDVTEVGLSAQVASIGGVDVTLGYTHRFYSGGGVAFAGAPVLPGNSSNGEIALGLSRDIGFATAHFDLFYNLNAPNSWNIAGPLNADSGAWFWDLGLDKEIGITDNISLVLSGGVTYADNYWGILPAAGNAPFGGGRRSSGWNNYYLRAALPIEINCAATITPYIGYSGAPDGFLMDGTVAGGSSAFVSQSDILHGGVSLTVKF